MTLRELRIWHWERVLKASKKRRDGVYYSIPVLVEIAKEEWNLHIGAVQALNDVPELHDSTAEQDLAQRT